MMLEPHPLAELFPMMEGEQFAALVNDIRENGLREPIVTHEGKILDGRNRYKACAEVGVEPITRQWDQRGDALSYVISKNLTRRHLNESQRAMVGARISNLKRGGDRGNQHTGGKPSIDGLPSQERTGALLNVGTKSVERAVRVMKHATPELMAEVDSGHVSLHAAEMIATQPEEKQKEIVMRGEDAIVAEAAAIRRARRPAEGLSNRRINANIWIAFRDAMEGLSGMPLASDVAAIVRVHDKAGITEQRLERAIRWLSEFERAWREINSKAA